MDALRGYGFQIYGSVLAWTNLDEEEVLHLELVEDYATATADALHATQAKDTRGSGSVTLNTPGVIQAIEALVDLADRNPERAVHLRYMTTSPIGLEARPGDRVEGEPGLAYWGRVAAGHADPGPLVGRLRAMPLKPRTKALLATRDDDALVRGLVSRLHWDCGRGGIDAIRLQIEARLTRTGGVHGQQVQVAEAGRVVGALVEHAFKTATQAGTRALTASDLRRAVQEATHVALPRRQLSNLLGALELLGHQSTVAFAPSRLPSWIDRVDDLPPPRRNLDRPVLADAIARALGRRERVGVLFGATGVGKTLLARSAAMATGGSWHSLDLLTEGASEAVERLRTVLGRIDDLGAEGLIVEDFDASEVPAAVRALSALVAAMRRDGRPCLVTTHREPSPGMLEAIGTGRDASVQVTHLDERETGRLAVLGGGSESLGGLIWLASAGGHPRLAQAVVADLEARGWSRDALDEYLGGETPRELRRERADARKRLLATVRDEDARVMLYRASLVLGRFDRRTAFALGSVDPRTRQPGETLDRLVGPWIDEVGPDQFRVSPLLGDAGERSLSEDEQRRTHAAVAGAIMAEGAISVSQADALLFHGLRGKLVTAILALTSGLLGADLDQKRMLAEWSHVLRCLPTDALPYPDNPSLSLVLRVAQFEALVIRGTDEELGRCVPALLREVSTARSVEGGPPMEAAVLAQVLTERRTGAILVEQWPDLLVRLAALVEGDDAFAQKFDSRLTLLGMIFSVHAHAAADVAGLEALFDRIDRMDPAGRSVLVRASGEAVEGLDLILRHPLFEDVKRATLAWREAADRYARMAGRARAWGASELALRCHATRAVAIAEIGREPEKALRSLDQAERDLGPDLVLSRERGKILGRRGDHAGALPLLTRCMDDDRNGAYERAVLAREVALSAAGLDQHASARDRFDDVGRIATTVGTPLSHMAVGSMADAAVSEVKLGRGREALTRLADCLERLDELGPPSDLKSAYVHRLVRHAVLWTFAELSGMNATAQDDRIRIEPGMCGVAEPTTDFQGMPLSPLAEGWCLLATVDVECDLDAGIERRIPDRMHDEIEPRSEVRLRLARMSRAIRRSNVDDYLEALGPWIDAHAWIGRRATAIGDEGTGGMPLSQVRTEEWPHGGPRSALLASLTAFVLAAATREETGRLDELDAKLRSSIDDDALGREVASRVAVPAAVEGVPRTLAETAALMRPGRPRDPVDSMRVSIRLLQAAAQVVELGLGEAVGKPLADWIGAEWSRSATRQAFSLVAPSRSAPAILEAVASSTGDVRSAARIVEAALPAVGAIASGGIRSFVAAMAGRRRASSA